MGIRDDVKGGACRNEYIWVSTAVEVLATLTQTSKKNVARWLLKKGVCRLIHGYTKSPTGEMVAKPINTPGGTDKYADGALHLIESGNRVSLLVYWQIPVLIQALRQCGENADAEAFYKAVEQPEDQPSSDDSNMKSHDDSRTSHLQQKICELEAALAKSQRELADLRKREGVGSDALHFAYVTRGLQLVAAVQQRYLGPNFEMQVADSRPAKSIVTNWLREHCEVKHEAEAAAIDRIAMPFSRGR